MSAGFGPLLLLPPFLLIVGILFLRAGRRRARGRGDAPHCRACGYNLTGLPSERCPECGTELTPANIMHGRPTRSMPLISTGVLMILAALLLLVPILTQVNWYALQPTSLLIGRLERGHDQRAWTELKRRLTQADLSDAHRSRLIDIGLKEQVATTAAPYCDDLMTLFSQWLLDNKFSDAQKKTFYDQIVEFQLIVRPKVIDGHSVPYELKHSGHLPPNLWAEETQEGAWVDGDDSMNRSGGSGRFSGMGGGGSMSTSVRAKGLGKHTLEVRPKIRVYAGPSLDPDKATLLHEQVFAVKGHFEIVPDSPEVRVRADATLATADSMRAAIVPSELKRGQQQWNKGKLDARIKIEAPPAPIAFKVYARIDGKEYPMGSIHKAAGQRTHWSITSDKAVPDAKRCDLIFRSDLETAQRTPDLTEIWAGELVYPNLPIPYDASKTGLPPATTTSPDE